MTKNTRLSALWAVLMVLAPMTTAAMAAPSVEGESPQLFTRDMTEQQVDEAIRAAMPFPVVSIVHGVKDNQRHFAVNMNIARLMKSQPVFNVQFHVPVSADRALMDKAIAAAGRYAVVAARKLK